MNTNSKLIQPDLKLRYDKIYEILSDVNNSDNVRFLNILEETRSDSELLAAMSYVIENKWIGGLPYIEKDISGYFSGTLSGEVYVSTDGLRFIHFYEKYKEDEYDIVSMVKGDSQLIRYFEKQNKYSFWKSLITNIVVIILTAACTAYFSS